jgi:hypothetical protein
MPTYFWWIVAGFVIVFVGILIELWARRRDAKYCATCGLIITDDVFMHDAGRTFHLHCRHDLPKGQRR